MWRVITDYRDDDDFDQDIYIKPVLNPYSAYCDPDAKEFDRRDAQFWFLSDHMGKEAFKQKYPDADLTNFESGTTVGESYLSWYEGDPMKMPAYTLLTLPSAATYIDCLVVCTNLTEGRRLVYSDGTNWLRLTNNTVAN